MPPASNPLNRLMRRRSGTSNTDKLYGSIVAQARLPVFYRSLGIPDSLEGRFALLSLHLFAVLHRLKGEGAAALALAQELVDRFSKDMETVLRELGVSDLRIPKTMRGLAASSLALLEGYESRLTRRARQPSPLRSPQACRIDPAHARLSSERSRFLSKAR